MIVYLKASYIDNITEFSATDLPVMTGEDKAIMNGQMFYDNISTLNGHEIYGQFPPEYESLLEDIENEYGITRLPAEEQ